MFPNPTTKENQTHDRAPEDAPTSAEGYRNEDTEESMTAWERERASTQKHERDRRREAHLMRWHQRQAAERAARVAEASAPRANPIATLQPVAWIDDTPTAFLLALPDGRHAIVTERVKRIHEGRPECLPTES